MYEEKEPLIVIEMIRSQIRDILNLRNSLKIIGA